MCNKSLEMLVSRCVVTADTVSYCVCNPDLSQSRACFQGLSHGNSFGGSLSPQQA